MKKSKFRLCWLERSEVVDRGSPGVVGAVPRPAGWLAGWLECTVRRTVPMVGGR